MSDLTLSKLRDCLQQLLDEGVPPDAPVAHCGEGGYVMMPISAVGECGVERHGWRDDDGAGVVVLETPPAIRHDYWATVRGA